MRGGRIQKSEFRRREGRWIDDFLSIVDPFGYAQDRFYIEVEPGIHRDGRFLHVRRADSPKCLRGKGLWLHYPKCLCRKGLRLICLDWVRFV